MAFRVRDLDYYTRSFNNTTPDFKMDTSVNSDVTSQMASAMARNERDRYDIKDQRSVLDRGFDFLLTPLYSTAGGVRGVVDNFNGQDESDISPLEGITGGLRAGNPFGEGYEKGEHTYSKVLGDMGWNPTSTAGKIAKGTLGFGLDVALDPTTYLTGGASALVKGTGRIGAGGQKLNHMTQEMAEGVIRRQMGKRGVQLGDEEVTRDATRLADEYNKLRGIRDLDPTPISFGLRNLPFGDKIKGSDKLTWTLSDGQKVREFSDKVGISRAYSKLRDAVYMSKLGEKFSTTSPLYRLAKTDPSGLADYLKAIEYTKGLNMDKLKSEQFIREKGKQLFNLTPAESKQVIELMQDKTVWADVKNTVKLLNTKEAQGFRDDLESQYNSARAELDDLLQTRNNVEALKSATEDDLFNARDEVELLRGTYRNRLHNLRLDYVDNEDELKELIKLYEDEASSIKSGLDELYNTNGVDKNALVEKMGQYEELLNKSKKFYDVRNNVIQQQRDALSNRKDAPPWAVAQDTKKYSKDIVKAIQETYDDATSTELIKMLDEAPDKSIKHEIVKDLSQLIFGSPDELSVAISNKGIRDLMKMVDAGKTRSQMMEYVEKRKDWFNGKANDMFNYISKEMGYDDWDKEYVKPMQEYIKRIKDGEELTPGELNDVAKLQQMNLRRQAMIGMLDKMTHSELMKYISKQENERMFKDFADLESSAYNPNDFPRELIDESRSGFVDDISANVDRKVKEFVDKSLKGGELSDIDKQDIVNDIVERVFSTNFGELTDTKLRWINGVVNEVDDIAKNELRTDYADMTKPQKDLVVNMAMNRTAKRGSELRKSGDDEFVRNAEEEAQRRLRDRQIEAIEKEVQPGHMIMFKHEDKPWKGTVEEVVGEDSGLKYNVRLLDGSTLENVKSSDVMKVKLQKQNMTPDEIIAKSPTTQRTMERYKELEKQIDSFKKELDARNVQWRNGAKQLFDEFYTKVKDLRSHIKDLEVSQSNLEDALNSGDLTKIDALQKKVNKMEDIVLNDDAFETYMRATFGEKAINRIIKNAQPTQSAKIMLDSMQDVPDKIKNIAKMLRGEFRKIGEDEVGIGRLTQDQFDAMIMTYVPHIATPDGQRFLNKYKIVHNGDELTFVERELSDRKPSITQDLGYGLKFNPHALERTIKNIKLPNGEWVTNPTIEQINESLAPLLKGKNLFSENIADIYLTRALKNSEVMYDDAYMKNMMDVFGDAIQGDTVKDGFKAVVNIGQLREGVRKIANQQVELKRSRGLSASYNDELQKVLGDMGISPSTLDEVATPMVELTQDQIAGVQRLLPGVAKQVNESIVQKANQSRKLQIAKDQSRLLQLYDKFTHFIKLNMTTVMPSFHMRNAMANTYLNWLKVGRDAFSYDYHKKALKAVRHQGSVEELRKIEPIVTQNNVYHWDEIYEQAIANHVIDEGFFAKDIGAESSSTGKLPVKPKFDPTDTENFVLYRKGGEVGNTIENTSRLVHFASLLKQGKSVEEAGKSSREFLFDYGDLTAFEMTYMKRILPFYTWLRKNSRLQVGQMLEQPGKFRDVAKVMSGVEGMNNEEDRINKALVNDFAQDWVQTPFNVQNAEGRTEPVLWNPNLPFMDLARIPNPLEPVGSMKEMFTQTNPMIKVPIEQALNHNTFFESPIVREGEGQVPERLDHVLSNMALYNAGSGTAEKEGVDLGLHVFNALSGIKGLSYDYDKYKQYKIAELLEEQNANQQASTPYIPTSAPSNSENNLLNRWVNGELNDMEKQVLREKLLNMRGKVEDMGYTIFEDLSVGNYNE